MEVVPQTLIEPTLFNSAMHKQPHPLVRPGRFSFLQQGPSTNRVKHRVVALRGGQALAVVVKTELRCVEMRLSSLNRVWK